MDASVATCSPCAKNIIEVDHEWQQWLTIVFLAAIRARYETVDDQFPMVGISLASRLSLRLIMERKPLEDLPYRQLSWLYVAMQIDAFAYV